MAKPKKASKSGTTARHIQLSGPRSPFQLVETQGTAGAKSVRAAVGAAPKAVSADAGDPSGIKSYIAFSVAHAIYPQGAGVNPDQDISDDVQLNSATIAAEINVDAQHSATIHQLKWTPVTADDVSKFKTVSDLMNQVKTNLSDPSGTA